MSTIARDFFTVEAVIQRDREQRESVKGRETPFRVEFRFRQGTRHYQYFENMETAMQANSAIASYGFTGRARIEHPLSQVIQVRGPRGGWRAAPKTDVGGER
jgi:hypothetical protein